MMQVKINDKMVEVFAGARVEDVLRTYSVEEWLLVREGKKCILDRHGHEMDLTGELNGGEELRLSDCVQGEKGQ